MSSSALRQYILHPLTGCQCQSKCNHEGHALLVPSAQHWHHCGQENVHRSREYKDENKSGKQVHIHRAEGEPLKLVSNRYEEEGER